MRAVGHNSQSSAAVRPIGRPAPRMHARACLARWQSKPAALPLAMEKEPPAPGSRQKR